MKRLIFVWIMMGLMSLAVVPAAAQQNLLGNGSFDSEVYRSYSAGYTVPDYWNGGYLERKANEEVWRNAEPTGFPHDADFRRAGPRSFHMARGGSTFTAWIFQQVNVVPGTTLRGGAWAYVVGGPWSYAWVGIDVGGGRDPYSGNIAWTSITGVTNRWVELSINATALTGTVTLFLFAEQSAPYDPNGVYWDEAYLIATSVPANPAPAPAITNPATVSSVPAGSQLMNPNRRVNVRAGQGTNFEVLGVARPGEIFTVLGVSGNWVQIDYLGRVGYVAANLVTITGAAAAQSEAAISSDVTFTTSNRVNLRAGPTASSARLAGLPSGATMKAISRTANNDWLQVEYNGQVGWVAARYGRISGNVFSLPAQ